MPSKCVPWIVLQVLSSTRTSRGSLRIPKRPSKDENLFSTGGGTLESSVTHTVLTPPAKPVQFSWLKMPSKCVPSIVLQISSSTRTSRGSLRPLKRPSKARNGQNITRFGLDPTILVCWPNKPVAWWGIHRRTYNSKRYPLYIEPFGLQRADTGEKKQELAYIPIIQYTYTKKSSWPKQKGSNSSQIIQWSSGGYITIHFRGLRGLRRAQEAKILTFWPKNSKWLFSPVFIF